MGGQGTETERNYTLYRRDVVRRWPKSRHRTVTLLAIRAKLAALPGGRAK